MGGEQQGRNHGGESHQGIGAVEDAHHGSQGGCGSQGDGDQVEPLVDIAVFCSEYEGETFGAIVGEGEHGGEGEDCHTDGEEVGAYSRHGQLKGIGGHGDPVRFSGIPDASYDQGQGGHGADHDGVYYRSKHGHQSFPHGLIGFGSTMGHGGGSDASLVGEGCTPDSGDNQGTQRSAQHRIGTKGILEDQCKAGKDAPGVGEDDIEDQDHIEGDH